MYLEKENKHKAKIINYARGKTNVSYQEELNKTKINLHDHILAMIALGIGRENYGESFWHKYS